MRAERPDAIVITFPVQFLFDLGYDRYCKKSRDEQAEFVVTSGGDQQGFKKALILLGYRDCIQQIEYIITYPDDNIWFHSIGSKPTIEVQYAYISILNKIRYRANIAAWEKGHEKHFQDGRKRSAKHWLTLSDFVAAPEEIEFKGCQGFRYTGMLF